MSLDVFFAQDINNLMAGMLETVSESAMSMEKQAGYLLAMRSMARAFGLHDTANQIWLIATSEVVSPVPSSQWQVSEATHNHIPLVERHRRARLATADTRRRNASSSEDS